MEVGDIIEIFKLKKNKICKVTKLIPTSKKIFQRKVLQFKKAHTMFLNSQVKNLTESIHKENKVSMLLTQYHRLALNVSNGCAKQSIEVL